MADMFDALLEESGGDPSALIAQLRRQNTLGQMAQLSGDRVLSPIGRQQSASAQEMAAQLGQQKSQRQLRQEERAFREQQNQQSQQNTDRAYQLQLAQAAMNEQFRRDQLEQTAADRAASREQTESNAKIAADARRAASANAEAKTARNLRGELNKVDSTNALVTEAQNILKSSAAPGTSIPTRMLRSTYEALGGATEGTESLSKLQSIGSLLVQAAPKLGGAASDRDVLLYQEAAGKLADPSVPNRAKLAALETMQGVITRNKEHFDAELSALTGQPTQKQQDQDWLSQFQVIR